MPLTPLAGSTRLRSFQIGIESTFKTQVPATRRMPWSVTPTVDPHWTFPTADTGTLDQAIAPYRMAEDVTLAINAAQMYANDIPALMGPSIQGNITPSLLGLTAYQWAWQPVATSQDVFDTLTTEFGDDATADDWAAVGCIIENWTLTYPQDQGPITIDGTVRGAKTVYPSTKTGSLNVDLNPVPMYMADTELYINDTAGAIGTTKISDTLYDASISYNGNIDVKRFANGNSTRFEVANYGRGERVVEFTINGTKDAAMVAESVKWIADSPSERFMELRTTSKSYAGLGLPYSLSIRIPGFWITRAWTEIASNTGFSLTGHQIVDPTLQYPFRIVAVNRQATLAAA